MASTNEWRVDPFTGIKYPQALSEIHTVEFNSDWQGYGFHTLEAVNLDSPSTVVVTENVTGGATWTEVSRSATLSPGQYQVDYEADTFTGTARFKFNAADVGKSFVVEYRGLGLVNTQDNLENQLTGASIPGDFNVEGDLSTDGDLNVSGNINISGSISIVPRIAVFISSGTWNIPSGVTKAKIKVIGGGGGGGAAANINFGGGGGGGGGVSEKIITGLTPGGTVAVTVGSGGTGGVSGGAAATAGGSSSFGAYCSATGGAIGTPSTGGIATFGGASGIGSSGDLNYGLGSGNPGIYSAGIFGSGGTGGGPNGGINGAAGSGFGSGGGGGYANPTGNGGAGSSGVVIIEY